MKDLKERIDRKKKISFNYMVAAPTQQTLIFGSKAQPLIIITSFFVNKGHIGNLIVLNNTHNQCKRTLVFFKLFNYCICIFMHNKGLNTKDYTKKP